MADILSPEGLRATRRPFSSRSPQAWIRRRARRLARAFRLSHREALECAIDDWNAFNPRAIKAAQEARHVEA